MRIRKPGRINDNLWLLGCEKSCVYLLQGDTDSMIISGGMSYIVPDLLHQFEDFAIDENRITKLLILHSHFDHVGIIPFMKRRNKKLTVYGSSRAWDILHMPKAINTINEFGRNVARKVGKEDVYSRYDLEWRETVTGVTLAQGDIIDLGNITGEIHETPGHSSCSISLYVPRLKALFPSDAAGIPFQDTLVISANSNFTSYQESLEKLKEVKLNYVCADHYGYMTGNEAFNYIQQTIDSAKDFREMLERFYIKERNIETAAKKMATSFCEGNSDYLLTPEIMEGVYRQMFKHIAENMDKIRMPL